MKIKSCILYLVCFIFLPMSLSARENIKVVENGWNDKLDNNRSVSSSLSLSKDESTIYLFSEKQLSNLCITIKDLSGAIIYTETTTVLGEMEYPIAINTLPQGEYLISITQGENYILGYFTK